MSNNEKVEFVYEDIASSSKKFSKKGMSSAEIYANNAVRHIDKVIKVISFIVSIGVLLVFVAIGMLLIMMDKIFTVVAVGLIIVGIVLSLILLFLIYATGHIISQNNEILKRL